MIGLCSGRFATQSQDDDEPSQDVPSQFPLLSSTDPLFNTESRLVHGIESQDTVILGSRPDSRAEMSLAPSNNFTQDDTVILPQTNQTKLNASINNILKNLDDDEDNDDVGHGVINSDDEDSNVDADDSLKISKKRKGRLLSDSEDDDDEADNKDEEEEAPEKEYDSKENEVFEKQKKAKQKLFDKKGKLRRDFYEDEAELSDEEGRALDVSDDEDEKDLDRFELEDGDLDEIDEDAEREKVQNPTLY